MLPLLRPLLFPEDPIIRGDSSVVLGKTAIANCDRHIDVSLPGNLSSTTRAKLLFGSFPLRVSISGQIEVSSNERIGDDCRKWGNSCPISGHHELNSLKETLRTITSAAFRLEEWRNSVAVSGLTLKCCRHPWNQL